MLENIQKKIFKVVITGGPCAGKSTAMSKMVEEFTAHGYTVLIVPETATELITADFSPHINVGGSWIDRRHLEDN